jgi:hypothetical protein
MEKPHVNFTLAEMRDYIRQKKLNVKPITLNLSRAETIATLKKLGHWDDSVKKKKRVPKDKKQLKAAEKASRQATIKTEDKAKKAFDEFVKLHVKYIERFSDEGLMKLKKQKRTAMNVSDMSDTLLKEMEDIRKTIEPSLIAKFVNKKVIDAQKKVKELSKNVKSRYQKISSVKKSEKKQKVLAIEDKPPAKKPAPPKGKNVGAKVKAIEDKATPPPTKRKSKSQPPTGPEIAKKDRELYVADFFVKYKQKTNVYKVLKEFDKRLGGKQSAMLVPLDEVKQIRKKSIVKLHPDKGGDADKFDMVNDAFNALIQSYKVDGYKSYETLLKERRAEEAKKN